ncbi:hypothetical protein [Prosthecobacter sp.]|uniref:hypothetical protein n=1 Tax=Prosthecobacter sp. TaxID=1965333 RepID=UPI003784893A
MRFLRPLLLALTLSAAVCSIPPSQAAGKGDAATQALNDAKDLTRAGEYEAALERHQWYHANALSISPAQYGVRLSFALTYWKHLGEKYPPAMAALTKLRDEGTQAALEGKAKPELFHDVVSINRTLSEDAASVKLFKTLDEKQPDFAKQCFRFVQDALLSAGEIDLFARHCGDTAKFLQGKLKEHQQLMKAIANSPASATSRQHFENRLVTLTLALSEHAAAQGDPNLAAHLKQMTAEVIADPRLTK